MQVAVGNATKLLDYLPSDKEYVADIVFGYKSTTYDDEGDKFFVEVPNFTYDDLILVLNSFVGVTQQIPPKYSAIKINGKKMCDLARKNIDFNVKSREIEIYSIDLLEFKSNCAKIKVFCKKGTYIRSLVNDIGDKLKCGAYMSNLVRTKAGDFNIETSDNIELKLNPKNVLDVLKLPKLPLNILQYTKIMNGNFIDFIDDGTYSHGQEFLLTKDNKLVSLAVLSDNLIKPKKVFKEV